MRVRDAGVAVLYDTQTQPGQKFTCATSTHTRWSVLARQRLYYNHLGESTSPFGFQNFLQGVFDACALQLGPGVCQTPLQL